MPPPRIGACVRVGSQRAGHGAMPLGGVTVHQDPSRGGAIMNIRNYRRQRLAISIVAALVAAQLPLAYAQDAVAPASDEPETGKQVTTLPHLPVRAQQRGGVERK